MKTTGNSIDIFGDSFSCPDCKFDSTDTWLDILEQKYHFTLKNMSLQGTGAQWCIEQFMGLDEFSDFLLFCLPDMNRLWLDYLPEYESSSASMIYSVMDRNSFDLPEIISEEIKDQADRIYKDYESFYSTGLNRILEILYASFIFTKHKKYEKILIWPASGLGYPFQNYNYTLEIPKNVYIVPRCLNFISHFEKKKKKNDDVIFFDKDTRNNHLSNENHVILAKQIFDFFIDDKIPEPTTFKNNFYEVQ